MWNETVLENGSALLWKGRREVSHGIISRTMHNTTALTCEVYLHSTTWNWHMNKLLQTLAQMTCFLNIFTASNQGRGNGVTGTQAWYRSPRQTTTTVQDFYLGVFSLDRQCSSLPVGVYCYVWVRNLCSCRCPSAELAKKATREGCCVWILLPPTHQLPTVSWMAHRKPPRVVVRRGLEVIHCNLYSCSIN